VRHMVTTRLISILIVPTLLALSPHAYPQDAGHYNTEGLACYRSGDYAGAVRMFERAYRLEPDNKTIRSNLANAHVAAAKELVDANDLDSAIEELAAALELRGEDANLYAYTASLCLKTGDLMSAEGMLLSALDIDPEHKDGHLLLGEVYYRSGSLSEAIAEWRFILERDPSSKRARERLDKAERELKVEKDFVTAYNRRHFVINRDPERFEEESRTVLDILEKAYYSIGRDLRHFPRNPVQVLLYSSAQFSEATRVNPHIAAVYDGKIRVGLSGRDYDDESLERILRHEYTHVIVRALTSGNTPFWFNEGLAQYESEELDENKRRAISDALVSGELIPLKDLDATHIDFGGNGARMRLAYLEGFAAVDYLRRRFTRRHLFDFMYMLAQQYDTETALKSVYRRTYDGLHREVFSEYR